MLSFELTFDWVCFIMKLLYFPSKSEFISCFLSPATAVAVLYSILFYRNRFTFCLAVSMAPSFRVIISTSFMYDCSDYPILLSHSFVFLSSSWLASSSL